MKKLFLIVTFLAVALGAQSQTAAFKRSNTNLPFVTTAPATGVLLVERGGGLPPANMTIPNLGLQFSSNNAASATKAWNLIDATNIPATGFLGAQKFGQIPPMMTASYNVFPTSTELGLYTNAGFEGFNFSRWATNVLYFHSTNGMRSWGYDIVQMDDGWQSRTNGVLGWNTNIFPIGMPAYAALAHSLKMKVWAYTSFTTNTCNTNGVGSPIDKVYGDIQTIMSWGWDGVKFDTCADDLGSAKLNRDYLIKYFRLVSQARNDYYAIVQATNGTCRPFYLMAPLVYQVMDPDQSVVTAEVVDFLDGFFLNWNGLSVSLGEDYIANIRGMAHVAMNLRALIPPGKSVGMESFYGLNPGVGYAPGNWTNTLVLYAAMAAPMIGRFATWEYGTITNGTSAGLNAGAPEYQLLDSGKYWTNSNFIDILRDPAGIMSSLVWSNNGVEVWIRPMGSYDTAKDCVVTLSSSFSGSANTNVTINVGDFGGRTGTRYKWAETWTGTEGYFSNSFTVYLNTNSAIQYRIKPAPMFATSQLLANGFANAGISGTTTFFHPSSGAANASANAIAFRAPSDLKIRSLEVCLTYCSAVDTNYFRVYSNSVPTTLLATVSVTSATDVNNKSTGSDSSTVLNIPAGTMISIGTTNRSSTSQQVYGGWSLEVLK